ncbi:hypothetical protein VNO78_03744 [Psophocarpus tetragonolobus]|uniref:Lysine ketoglutarate reductase trans-splicing-like protein n=1 Tax=Psophocarpus tetragonolobus TaxID=3891 RepID=A0AAN9XW71_PSOTE
MVEERQRAKVKRSSSSWEGRSFGLSSRCCSVFWTAVPCYMLLVVGGKSNACSCVSVFFGPYASDAGKSSFKMKQLPFMAVLCTVMLFIVYRTTRYQYHEEEIDTKWSLWGQPKAYPSTSGKLKGLPRGIIHANSDLELRPLWSKSGARSKANVYSNRNLLAVPVGIKQKQNVDVMVQKFLRENFTVILFHYDGNVDGWWNLDWSSKAIHIAARNQTKWWFAKRFLHPDIVSIYDYIFLWDEDLGVEHFSPSRYVEIIKREGLEISQPALDPHSTEIHHKITIRARTKKFHRRLYERRGSTRCSDSSEGPPCTGFVEGMAPVFSRSAWYCTWHLIQNDLVYGWGVDMKLGYCSQGDRTKRVGVVDSEYIFHKGIQTLGGSGHRMTKVSKLQRTTLKQVGVGVDVRTEIRRQSTWEFEIFKERWNEAISQDKKWVDPFKSNQRLIRRRRDTQRLSKNSHLTL